MGGGGWVREQAISMILWSTRVSNPCKLLCLVKEELILILNAYLWW